MEESISLERAVELITGSAAPLGSEEITPSDSLGRVLARSAQRTAPGPLKIPLLC